MEEFYQPILISKNIPLFLEVIQSDIHKIFYKYISEKYYTYIFSLLGTLCKNCPYQNKFPIFYTSLNYILKVLYKLENHPFINNLDLIILNCFTLGIKSITRQELHPSIKKLKNCCYQKYMNYPREQICKGEINCLKLLDYNINILTPYDYIAYLSQNDLRLRELSTNNLNSLLKKSLNRYLYEYPLDLAKECLNIIKEKIIYKEPKIIQRKIISSKSPFYKKCSNSDKILNNNSNNKNNEQKDENCTQMIRVKKIQYFNNNMNNSLIKSSKLNMMINNIRINNNNENCKIYKKKNCNAGNINYSIIPDNNRETNNNYMINKFKINSYNKYIYNNMSKGKIQYYTSIKNNSNRNEFLSCKNTLNYGKENDINSDNMNNIQNENCDIKKRISEIKIKSINMNHLNKTINRNYNKSNLVKLRSEDFENANIINEKLVDFSNIENIPLNKSLNNLGSYYIKW